MIARLPEPLAEIAVESADGAVLRVRRHGNVHAATRLFVSHGNGFAIDGYIDFWSRFLAEFEVVAFDMRSHGHNPVAEPANHDYAHMAQDIDAVGRAVRGRIRPQAVGRAVSFDVGAVGDVADDRRPRAFRRAGRVRSAERAGPRPSGARGDGRLRAQAGALGERASDPFRRPGRPRGRFRGDPLRTALGAPAPLSRWRGRSCGRRRRLGAGLPARARSIDVSAGDRSRAVAPPGRTCRSRSR